MYLKARGRRLHSRNNISHGRSQESELETAHGDKSGMSLFNVYEYSEAALEDAEVRNREYDIGQRRRLRIAGAFSAFKIMDHAAQILGVD